MCPPEMITSTGTGLAVICLLFNIFIPGVGTMINACAGTQYVGKGICYGLLQMLLAGLLIGWICIWKACSRQNMNQQYLPAGVATSEDRDLKRHWKKMGTTNQVWPDGAKYEGYWKDDTAVSE
eukprot:403366230